MFEDLLTLTKKEDLDRMVVVLELCTIFTTQPYIDCCIHFIFTRGNAMQCNECNGSEEKIKRERCWCKVVP